MSDRVVYTFPSNGAGEYRIVARQQRPGPHESEWLYGLVRTGILGHDLNASHITRGQLGELGEAIVRELLAS